MKKISVIFGLAVLTVCVANGAMQVSNLGVGELTADDVVIRQTTSGVLDMWNSSDGVANYRGVLFASEIICADFTINKIYLQAGDNGTMDGDLLVDFFQVGTSTGLSFAEVRDAYAAGNTTALFSESLSVPSVDVAAGKWFEIDLGTNVVFNAGYSYGYRVALTNQASTIRIRKQNQQMVMGMVLVVGTGANAGNAEHVFGLGGTSTRTGMAVYNTGNASLLQSDILISQEVGNTADAFANSDSTASQKRGVLLSSAVVSTNYSIDTVYLKSNNNATMDGDLQIQFFRVGEVGAGLTMTEARDLYNAGTNETVLFTGDVSSPGSPVVAGSWFAVDLGEKVQFEADTCYGYRATLLNQTTTLNIKRSNLNEDPEMAFINQGGANAGSFEHVFGLGGRVFLETKVLYEEWAGAYLLSGTNALMSADPDGDGFNNLYEFSLGGDPTNALNQGYAHRCEVFEESGTNYFVYVHPRLQDPDCGVAYSLKLADDLIAANWTSAGFAVSSLSGDLGNGYEVVTNFVSTNGKPRQFLKLNMRSKLDVGSYDLGSMVQSFSDAGTYQDPGYYTWGPNLITGEDGKYYMVYSRWPEAEGFGSWVSHSEVGLAVADAPEGPYRHVKVLLSGRGAGFWDEGTIHNPRIIKADNKYYLYYVGSLISTNWHSMQRGMRIGVAVADSIEGPYSRSDTPLLGPGGEVYAYTANPSIVPLKDGRYLMMVKGASADYPDGQPRPPGFSHGIAFADHPDGPFVYDVNAEISMSGFEDPSAWYDSDLEHFFCVVHNWSGIALLHSPDGKVWGPCDPLRVTTKTLQKEGIGDYVVGRIERPSVLMENDEPRVLAVAVTRAGSAFNIILPLENAFD